MSIILATPAEAQAAYAAQPANIVIYGPPGSLKTTDVADAFTTGGVCRAFFIPCEDGALKTIVRRGLPMPGCILDAETRQPRAVKSWPEFEEVMKLLVELRMSGRCPYTAIAVDTLSTLTGYLYKHAQVAYKNWDIPNYVRNCMFTVREWARHIGLHCVLIAHASRPTIDEKGIFWPGGPLLSPKTMAEQFHGLVDTVLRVDHLRSPGKPTVRVYWTGGPDWPPEIGPPPSDAAQWRAKNRDGVRWTVVPADLRAYLLMSNPPYVL